MRTNLFVIPLFVLVIVGLPLSAVKGIIAPTPLEGALDMAKSNKPDEALEALSIYQPSHEEFSAYHYAEAQVLVQLNKQHDSIAHYRLAYLYAGSEAEEKNCCWNGLRPAWQIPIIGSSNSARHWRILKKWNER